MSIDGPLNLLLSHFAGAISLIDVGARWGANERWRKIGDRAIVLGFEPDIQECERLNATRPTNVRYLPFALASKEEKRDLYITVQPACSSLHHPIKELYENYPALSELKPERIVSVPCRRLDDVLFDERIETVSGIKLDTQGSELEILRGSKRALEACALIDIEVEFNPLYGGQDLFCDVDRFLRDHGFVLWRFENLVHYAPEPVAAARAEFVVANDPTLPVTISVSNGQVFWAQAQYVRAEYPRTGADYLPLELAIVPAVLAGVYGFWDLSLELVRKTGDVMLLRALRDALST